MVLTHLQDTYLDTTHVTRDYAKTVQHVRQLSDTNEVLLKAGR